MLKASPVFAFLIFLVVLCAPVAPVLAEPGPSLLGVNSQVVATPVAAPALGTVTPRADTSVKTDDRSWLSKFGSGFVDGVLHALPNMWKAVKENPLMTVGLVAGAVVLAVAAPVVATVVGVGLTVGTIGYAAYQSGGDPTKIGQVVGETAFWAAAGLGVAKGITAVKALNAGKAAAAAEGVVAEVNAVSKGVKATTAAETAVADAAATNKSLPVLNNTLCFVAGTRVLTAQGERAIQSLSVGDEVLTWSPLPRTSMRTLALGVALAMIQPASAAVVSDVSGPIPRIKLQYATYDADGTARGMTAFTRLSAGQLVRSGDRLWRVAKLDLTGGIALQCESTDFAIGHVTRLFSRTTSAVHDLTTRHVDGRETRVSGTSEHPFYVPSRLAWIKLADLKPGTDVATSDGRVARVTANVRRDSAERVFNFEVPGTHNYYVSDAGDAPALLAHNQCHGDRILGATSKVEAALAGDATAASEAINGVTKATGNARGRVVELVKDVRKNPATAPGTANEIRGVATGAEKSAAELRALAAKSADPAVTARLEAEAAQLERLAKQSENLAKQLDTRAASLPDRQAIATEAAKIKGAVDKIPAEKGRVRAGVTEEGSAEAYAGQQYKAKNPKDRTETLPPPEHPTLRSMATEIEQWQVQLIQREQTAIRSMSPEQQIQFLKETQRSAKFAELEALTAQKVKTSINRGTIKSDVDLYEAQLKTMTSEQLQAEITARYAELAVESTQTQMERFANAFGGTRLSPNKPGACAEWPALEQALASKPPTNPPGKGLSMSAVDASGLYKPPCMYCQFMANKLGIQIVR